MTKFISNKEIGKDLFDGRSHQSIADSISEVIKIDADARRVIGLEGEWGSGKSNITGILKKDLKTFAHGNDTITCRYHIYDLWTHQSDDVRKTLLRSIVNDLCDAKIVDDSWKEKVKRLFATHREVVERNKPRFSTGMVCIALIIILTSIYELFKDFIEDNIAASVALWLLLIVTAIVILNLCWNLFCSFKHNFDRQALKPTKESGHQFRNWGWNLACYVAYSIGDAFARSYSVFADQDTDKETESYDFEDVTTADGFREEISKLDKHIAKSKQHYIIILDNFDRVQPDKVQELWASLITLFGEAKFGAITIVVPFDRAHVKKAFETNFDVSEADDFINKTFNCVFRVSQPMMTAWKVFFHEKWEDAFGQPEKGEVELIFELIENKITPRSIIAFINKIVTIQLWTRRTQTQIPYKYSALYVLCKDKISEGNPVEHIVNSDYLDNVAFIFKNDVALPKYMAALHYQLKPEKAEESVFVSNLKAAFDNNDVATVKTILSLPNWYHLLQTAITKVSNVPQTVLLMDEAIQDKQDNDISKLWDELYGRLGSKEKRLEKYQEILFEKILHKGYFLNFVLEGLTPTTDDLNQPGFTPVNYIKDIQRLEAIVPSHYNLPGRLKRIEVSAEQFIEAANYAEYRVKDYKISCKETDIDILLTGKDEASLDEIDYLPYVLGAGYKLEQFKDGLYKKVQGHQYRCLADENHR